MLRKAFLGSVAVVLSVGYVACGPGLHVPGWTGSTRPINLTHAIELIDASIRSQIPAATFAMSRTTFDTRDYDGTVTTRFEIVAKNVAASPHNITLVDSLGAVRAQIAIPASTSALTRMETAFTPVAGTDNYRVATSSGALNDATITAARILVTQVGATKTKLYVPMFQDSNIGFGDDGTASELESNTSYASAPLSPINHNIWAYRTANQGTLVSLTHEVVMNNGGGAFAVLYDRTTGAAVTASEVANGAGSPTLASATFLPSALTDGHEYEMRGRAAGGTTNLFKAGLWVTLNPLVRGEAYFRVFRARATSSTQVFDGGRVRLDLGAFTAPFVFWEAAGRYTAGGTITSDLLDDGANESGSGGSAVSGASHALLAATFLMRSSPISLNSGNRYQGKLAVSSGTPELRAAHVVVSFGN